MDPQTSRFYSQNFVEFKMKASMQVIASIEAALLGILVVINENIHAARHIKKIDSTNRIFESKNPGVVGQIRRGLPFYYITSLPLEEVYLMDSTD